MSDSADKLNRRHAIRERAMWRLTPKEQEVFDRLADRKEDIMTAEAYGVSPEGLERFKFEKWRTNRDGHMADRTPILKGSDGTSTPEKFLKKIVEDSGVHLGPETQ